MKKIKLLIVPSDTMGVGHFRSIWPGQSLDENFSDEVDVEINPTPNVDNIKYLSEFDIIHFHRHLGGYDKSSELFPKLKAAGVTLILDIDDFWEPPTTHPMYELVKREGLSEKIVNNIKLADYITTTTDTFASHIRKHNKNVFVIPNAIDSESRMWSSKVKENKTDKCRISWIGGSSHLHDLGLLKESMVKLHNSAELKDKFQIVMCGFDTRGNITEVRQDGSKVTRNIKPKETIWRKFEEIFTANFKVNGEDKEYFDWLAKAKKGEFKGAELKNYVRRWTLPLTKYGQHYDYCDVCLAPLVDTFIEEVEHKNKNGGVSKQVIKRRHLFNEVKSELKIIEAGMKGKALIAQDFGIYKDLIEDGKTGILVKDNKKGWYKAMKKVIENPEYREELANNLHEFVKDRYELKNVTKNRVEIYQLIMEKKNSDSGLELSDEEKKQILLKARSY